MIYLWFLLFFVKVLSVPLMFNWNLFSKTDLVVCLNLDYDFLFQTLSSDKVFLLFLFQRFKLVLLLNFVLQSKKYLILVVWVAFLSFFNRGERNQWEKILRITVQQPFYISINFIVVSLKDCGITLIYYSHDLPIVKHQIYNLDLKDFQKQALFVLKRHLTPDFLEALSMLLSGEITAG